MIVEISKKGGKEMKKKSFEGLAEEYEKWSSNFIVREILKVYTETDSHEVKIEALNF